MVLEDEAALEAFLSGMGLAAAEVGLFWVTGNALAAVGPLNAVAEPAAVDAKRYKNKNFNLKHYLVIHILKKFWSLKIKMFRPQY